MRYTRRGAQQALNREPQGLAHCPTRIGKDGFHLERVNS